MRLPWPQDPHRLSSLPASSLAATALVALLAVLLALFEAALTSLTRIRQPHGVPPAESGMIARVAADPSRARRAAVIVRVTLLAAMLMLAAAGWAGGSAWPALAAAITLSVLHLLEQQGQLRLFGARAPWLAAAAAAVLGPLSTLLPAARPGAAEPDDQASAAGALEDLADLFATAPEDRQRMVQALLDLEQSTVEDIMVPRSDVVGVDLRADWDDIISLLAHTPHTRLPLYDGDLQHVIGVLHMKRIANELASGRLTRARLRELAGRRETFFIPEGTNLQAQLMAFRKLRRRIAFVVDEYGDVLGLVALEDILEEIVGEFTTQPGSQQRHIQAQADGSFLVTGSAAVRGLNKALGWNLPTDGPKTLSGLIVECLETIPGRGTRLQLGAHRVEILQVGDNMVRTARVWPAAED